MLALIIFTLSLLSAEVVNAQLNIQVGLQLSLSLTLSPCLTCGVCNTGRCLQANGTGSCQCFDCAAACPSGCTCSLVPRILGAVDFICNKTCDSSCPLTLPNVFQQLPLCGLAPWNCDSNISIPSSLANLSPCCLLDPTTNNSCTWNCTKAALINVLPPANPCEGKCILDKKPLSCLAGTTLLTSTIFQATCDLITSTTGLATCGWKTNCGCQVTKNLLGGDMCGIFPKPANPCDAAAVASYSCTPSSLLGTCNWDVKCTNANGCDEGCDPANQPTSCPSGQKVRSGEDFNAICSANNATGGCAWKTNCVVDECAGACLLNLKPLSCPSPYSLISGATSVLCDCAKTSSNSQCQWIPKNCIPTPCVVSKVNDTLFCGIKKLTSALLCSKNPADICVRLADGTCDWNYQAPDLSLCPLITDIASTVLGGIPVPTCGGQLRPACPTGQTQSSNCGCAKVASGCDWVNNCEPINITRPSKCFLSRTLDLGWVCGGLQVPPCCADGSKFIPTLCETLLSGECVPRGYCDRTKIVDIDLSVLANVTVGTRTCNGAEEPKCPTGLLAVVLPKCVCSLSPLGINLCQWSPISCKAPTPCTTCPFPCGENQYIASGSCSSTPAGKRDAEQTCGWVNLECRDKPVPPKCTCDNLAPTTCPCGQKRDTSSAPVCLLDSLKRCVLKSTCVTDTCGGLGVDSCKCDYTKCVFLSAKANATIGNLGLNLGVDVGLNGFGGCFDPQSDVLRAVLSVATPGIEVNVAVSIPGSCPSQAPASANPGPAPAPRPVPAPPPCNRCNVIENVKAAISDQIRISAALQVFQQTQLRLRSTIDSATGCPLGQHFALSLVVVANPILRADASLDLNVMVEFVPLQNVLVPTDDHKRFFCPCIKDFLTNLGGFLDSDVLGKTCVWNDVKNLKRGVLVQDNPNSNSYTSSVNYPAPAVDRTYPESASSSSGAQNFSQNHSILSIVIPLILLLAFLVKN